MRFAVSEHLDIDDDALRLVVNALMRVHPQTNMRHEIAHHHARIAALAGPRGQFVRSFHGRRSITLLSFAAIESGAPIRRLRPEDLPAASGSCRPAYLPAWC